MHKGRAPRFPLWKPRVLRYAVHALATLDLVTGEAGPRLLPRFANDDHDLALASLQKIESVQARWILPGHGLPWQGSPRQAVKLARKAEAPKR